VVVVPYKGPSKFSTCLSSQEMVGNLDTNNSQRFSPSYSHLPRVAMNMVVGPYKGPAQFCTCLSLQGMVRTLDTSNSQ